MYCTVTMNTRNGFICVFEQHTALVVQIGQPHFFCRCHFKRRRQVRQLQVWLLVNQTNIQHTHKHNENINSMDTDGPHPNYRLTVQTTQTGVGHMVVCWQDMCAEPTWTEFRRNKHVFYEIQYFFIYCLTWDLFRSTFRRHTVDVLSTLILQLQVCQQQEIICL